jgi:hypothetical protein
MRFVFKRLNYGHTNDLMNLNVRTRKFYSVGGQTPTHTLYMNHFHENYQQTCNFLMLSFQIDVFIHIQVYCMVLCQLLTLHRITQRCTNPLSHVARVTTFCTVAPNICGPSVWNLLRVILLEIEVTDDSQIFGKSGQT